MMPLTCLVLMLLKAGQGLDAEALIRGHEDSILRIHSIRVKWTTRVSRDAGSHWMTMSRIQDRHSGRKERSHIEFENFFIKGRFEEGIGFKDFSYDSKVHLAMHGLNTGTPAGRACRLRPDAIGARDDHRGNRPPSPLRPAGVRR